MRTAALVLFVVSSLASGIAAAMEPGESLTYDAASKAYVVTWKDGSGTTRNAKFEPSTNISPFVTSSVAVGGNGISYSFALTSSSSSLQRLLGFSIDPVSNLTARRELVRTRPYDRSDPDLIDKFNACVEGMMKPTDWSPSCAATNVSGQTGLSLAWVAYTGIAPGAGTSGFGFASPDLPGLRAARLMGGSGGWLNNVEPDSTEISLDLDNAISNVTTRDYLERYIAVPAFAVSSPFDAVALLEKLRSHVAGWPARQLMDQILWSTVDGLLKGTIDGLKKADSKAAAANLTQIRAELRKKYPDLDLSTALDSPNARDLPKTPDALKAYLTAHDLRLAAHVLDFDVAYVTKKLDPAGVPQEGAGAKSRQ